MTKLGNKSKLKSFEKLYFENYRLLCHRVFRFIKDEEAAKDIVQEVFIKYWHRINELHITESETAYLSKACINASLNYLKEKNRRKERENTFAENRKENISDRPDMQYHTDEISRQIDNTIDLLPPACREAFLLSRHEAKNYKEIAELLNISVNTVEKHIGKALKKLREVLIRKEQ